MAEINLASDDITVLGGPASITLETNFGQSGTRGTFVMYGLLNPNDANAQFIATPEIFDLYVINNPADENYLQMYQYVNQAGNLLWVPAFKLTQNKYSTNRALTFNSGAATLDINIFELGLFDLRTEFPTLENTKYYFNVQVTHVLHGSDNPAATINVGIDDIAQDPVTDELYVPLTFYATTENDGDTLVASISIEIVDPTPVMEALGVGVS